MIKWRVLAYMIPYTALLHDDMQMLVNVMYLINAMTFM